ncbi:hypothetical protein [Megasphaera massiliensis]|uniref:hypothetical protein n=1 Tax=Megasphaera massiliensis TaxID=1232428 RepID=UPI0034A29496
MGNKLRLAAMLISVGLFMPLFVVRQWVSVNPGITTNSTSAIISLPIAFSEKHFCTILSDTAGRIAAVAGNDEGAFVTDRTLTSFRLFAAWSDGLNKEINAISIGV